MLIKSNSKLIKFDCIISFKLELSAYYSTLKVCNKSKLYLILKIIFPEKYVKSLEKSPTGIVVYYSVDEYKSNE